MQSINMDGRTFDVLVRTAGVSKRFCRSLKKSLWYGVQDIFADLAGTGAKSALRADEFWAVNDVSFELRRGECLGLIGHNGAGKTSILKMLSGLVKPDRGRIEIRGKVGGLIALGAGFNPILTGRENVYVNASVLGLSAKETGRKFDEIVDFAELHEFIDTPVKNYSSGMHVRLGFAIAAVLIEPDVLLLDEILAVGDIGFTIKCLNAVRVLSQNSAVILVSHNMQFISSFCTRVMVMKQGQCLLDAREPAKGIDHYYSMINQQRQESGTGGAKICSIHLKIGDEVLSEAEPGIPQGTVASAVIRLQIQSSRGAHLNAYIHDEATSPIICLPVLNDEGRPLLFEPGEFQFEVPLGTLDLAAGKYSFVLALRDANTALTLTRAEGLCVFRIVASRYYWGKIVRPAAVSTTRLR